MREIPLMNEFLGHYRNPIVRLFRRQIIDKTVKDIYTNRMLQVKAGVTGQSDAYGFIQRNKRPVFGNDGISGWTRDDLALAGCIEIEFKGEKTVVSEGQKVWRAFCAKWRIPHIELRAGPNETAIGTILRWSTELDTFVNNL